MQPRITAYLALENSASRTLRAAFEPHGEALVQSISNHMRRNDLAGALASLQAFDHTSSTAKARPRLKELAVSALLYGASRLKPLRETIFAQTLPHAIINTAVGQMITLAGTHAARKVVQDTRRVLLAPTPQKQHSILRKAGGDCCHHESRLICKAVADTEDYPDISDAMNAVVMGTGRALSDLAGNLTMSRLASFGFLSQAQRDGTTSYQISEIMDDRTCPICQYMDGKTFQVQQAFARTKTALSTDDPNDLKSLAPWPKQDKASIADFLSRDPEQLQAMGFDCPPFHPACRGVLVKDGSVSETLPPVRDIPTSQLEQGIKAMMEPAAKLQGQKSFMEWLDGLFGDHNGPSPTPDQEPDQDPDW